MLSLSTPTLGEQSLTTQAQTNDTLEEVIVWGRGISQLGKAGSASQGLVGYADFSTRPMLRVGELVEVMPGMVATQHSGSGKANQYFLRGMNLDHGTDFTVNFEGMPVNFRSHAHGQGYLDINFIIPEVIETVDYRKGTHYADSGDFSAAGSATFKTYDRLAQGFTELSVGEDGYERLVFANSHDLDRGTLLYAAELHNQDGPWELPEDTQKRNALVKYSTEIGPLTAQIIATAYTNSWNATDQIPQREVLEGRLSRFGYIDPSIGGETSRFSLIGKLSNEHLSASAYAVSYELNLFSNPTYFQEAPVEGDQIEQEDKRQIYGGSINYQNEVSLLGHRVIPNIGAEFRYDDIEDTNLFKTTGRQRSHALINDSVKELSLSAFAEAEIHWNDRLRSKVGLRADYYDWDVIAKVPADIANSGTGDDTILSPKFSMAYALADHTEVYASYGQGFHSNDVRGVEVETNPVEGLVKIDGAELGLRSEGIEGLNLTLALFRLETDSELIFVGDAGTTEPSDGAERYGLEVSAFWQMNDWLVLDLTAAKSKASFKGKPSGEDHVPDAHEIVAGAGVTATLDNGFVGSLRVRHFGAAPLDESDSVRKDATTLVNLGLSYGIGKIDLGLEVLNVLNTEANDIEFLFESQLENEVSPVEDIHFHPVAPRSVRASLRYSF